MDWPAARIGQRLILWHAQAMVRRGDKVLRQNRIGSRKRSVLVAFAIDDSPANAAAGHHGGEAAGPVIASIRPRAGIAISLTNTRRAAEFTRPNDKRLIQK